MSAFTLYNGYQWPASDRHAYKVVFDSVSDMEPALDLVRGHKVAVQAGGNCGVWANYLAERFDKVITVEPDTANFACLCANASPGVEYWRAAFGDRRMLADVKQVPGNTGAHFMTEGEGVEVITIDSLNLAACDYLCLDIEGYEMRALLGAVDTIERFKPVIQIEDKGLSEKYGYRKGDAEIWLAQFGYKVVHRIKRDVILACDAPA